jgi:hypothetical protein
VCPDGAPQKLRMVYATAKAGVATHAKTLRVMLERALEWGSLEMAELEQNGAGVLDLRVTRACLLNQTYS